MPLGESSAVSTVTLTPYQLQFIDDLAAASVRYLVVGGIAMHAHGVGRPTRDLDIVTERSRENAAALLPVIARRFRRTPDQLTLDWLCSDDKRIPMPMADDVEVDVLTSLGSLDFGLAFSGKIEFVTAGRTLPVLGLAEMIYSKVKSADRTESPEATLRDMNDLAALLNQWQERHNNALEQTRGP